MFHLFIATLEKTIYNGDVSSVMIPGTSGYFEVLTDHAPLISSLAPGKLVFKDESKIERIFAISGGVVEVSHNQVTVLGNAIESLEEIDVERARRAMKRAHRLVDFGDHTIDSVRAKKSLARAKNRLKVSGHLP